MRATGPPAVGAPAITTRARQSDAIHTTYARELGMSIGDLARYLMVSRQNLSGLISRMERDGHVTVAASGQDRRSRMVTMTDSGRHVWQDLALPKIYGYYDAILADFSVSDVTHTLHYLLKILENMQRLDAERLTAEEGEEIKAVTWCGAPPISAPVAPATGQAPTAVRRRRWMRSRGDA